MIIGGGNGGCGLLMQPVAVEMKPGGHPGLGWGIIIGGRIGGGCGGGAGRGSG